MSKKERGLEFLTRLIPVIVGISGICSLIWFIAAPHAKNWVLAILEDSNKTMSENIAANTRSINEFRNALTQSAKAQVTTAETLAQVSAAQKSISETMASTAERIRKLELSREADASPVLEFTLYGSTIEDGPPGGTIEVVWSFIKLRDGCGKPEVELFFRNGGGRLHRFTNVSVLDDNGRGVGLDARPRPQSLKYTVQIPADDGVLPGHGLGWNRITYPDCPSVPPAISPEIPFTILEREN
jgi:hypothetical protein